MNNKLIVGTVGLILITLGMCIKRRNKDKKVLGTFRYPKEIKKCVLVPSTDCIKVDDKLVYYREYKPAECSDIVEKDLVAEDLVINLKEGLIDEITSLAINVKDDKYQVSIVGYKNGKRKLVCGIIKKES